MPGRHLPGSATVSSPRRTRARAEPDEPDGPVSLSQVGRALVELGVGSIVAGSPQAKGRIERSVGDVPGPARHGAPAGRRDRPSTGANAFLRRLPGPPQRPLRRPGGRPGARLAGGARWRSGSSGSWCSSTGARSPATTRSGSTDGSSSCPAGTGSLELRGQAGRGPRPAGRLDRRLRRRTRAARRGGPAGPGSAAGPATSSAPSPVSSRHPLRSPGRRRPITPGSGSPRTASSTRSD